MAERRRPSWPRAVPIAPALVVFLFLPAAPAQAQPVADAPAAPPILPTLDRPCRVPGEEIVVCGRRDEERRSPYRLPEPPPRFDAGGGVASVSRERHGLYEHGDTGIHSCSTVGPGGYSGCTFRKWKESDEQWGGKDRGNRKRPTEY